MALAKWLKRRPGCWLRIGKVDPQMLRSPSLSLAASALLVLACSLNPIFAQRGGGMRLPNVSRVQLATLPEVAADTKLTDDQKTHAKSLKDKLDAKRGELMSGGGQNQEARAQLTKYTSELDTEFTAKLDDTQKKRFNGLLLQVNGAVAILDSAISQELGLSNESIKKLRQVNQENQAARREAMQSSNGEERMAKIRELNEKADSALLAVLSDAEKKKMEELKGAKLEIDTAPLRPGRRQQ